MDIIVRHADQLSAQLKSLRRLRGLSQTELGKRIGVGQARVAEIEAHPGAVGFDQLLRIFQALGSELLLRAVDVPATPVTKAAAAPAESSGWPMPQADADEVLNALARKLGTTVDKLRSVVDEAPRPTTLAAREPSPPSDSPEPEPGPLGLPRHRGSW